MESIGTKLRNKREAKKLSIEEVSKKTKIYPTVLEALEQDKFSILNNVYIKGFLRIYGNFLGLDTKEIIDEYDSLTGQKVPPVTAAQPQPKKAAVSGIKIGARHKPFLIIILLVIILLVFFGLSAKHKKKRVTVASNTFVSERTRPEPKKIKETPKPKKQVTVPQAELSPVRLGVRAKENCWLLVKLDGKTIFQGILRKGQSESWQAKDKIEVSVGNAGAIELEANGKILSPLGRRKEPIKNILITHEGTSIGK